jgi:hypothetical protein
MADQHGLDNRHRNENGETRAKNPTTQVATLREIYGEGFAQSARSDMTLGTLLARTGLPSLSQYLAAGKPPVPRKP